MKKRCLVVLSGFLIFGAAGSAQRGEPLRLVETIGLEGVEGRIDHFSADVQGQRLFVSALGNNTVEVLDLKAGKRAHSIKGLSEPQGVLYLRKFNKLLVANAKNGKAVIFDGESFAPLGQLDFSQDADNLRYDNAAKLAYVGYGDGGLGILDPASAQRVGDIKLAGHPESFQLEAMGTRIFVNVPDAGQIAVVDRAKRAEVAKWPVPGASANFPMALDEAHQRLFVTCRNPAQVMVFDVTSGKVIERLPVVGDADDKFYDASRRRIYISGGEGAISVIEQSDADHYRVAAKIPTASGARTSFFVPEFGRLYLAVPHRGQQGAEIRVYEAM